MPIREIEPFALLFAPAYVYLERNEKFVSVKAPLDFFSPADLVKLSNFESVYLPPFIDSVKPFADAGKRVRQLLSVPAYRATSSDSGHPMVALDPPPFVTSDEVIRVVAPLWSLSGERALIEPFFAAAFAGSVCDPLPGPLLVEAHDQDVEAYETAVFRSGWAVFTALHLGYCDLPFLNALLLEVFKGVLGIDAGRGFVSRPFGELASAMIAGSRCEAIPASALGETRGELDRQFAGRVRRIVELSGRAGERATIFGPGGLVGV